MFGGSNTGVLMANMNVGVPRFYCDNINYRFANGIAQNTRYDVQPTNSGNNIVGIKSGGGSEIELFDMNPLNLVTFDTSASSTTKADHVIITLDVMGEVASKNSFVAILNHNCATATAKIRISASDTKADVDHVDFSVLEGGATVLSCTEVVNADTISNNIITPATDGSTIVKFSETDLRYFGIQFEGSSGNFSSTDLTVGCILVGEIIEMPFGPDISLVRSINFDQVKVLESSGGQRFGNATSIGRTATSTSKSPFTTSTVNQQAFGGRITYDMQFSYMSSTDLMPDEYDIFNPTDDSVVEDIWNRTCGPLIPFIFSIDKDSEGDNSESEHIFARFAQNELVHEQVAINAFNVSMRIEEEF